MMRFIIPPILQDLVKDRLTHELVIEAAAITDTEREANEAEETRISLDFIHQANLRKLLVLPDPALTEEDLRVIIEKVTVPVPSNEGKRLKILRQSNLLDSNTMDPEFDRFTSLAHRIFDVSCSYIKLLFMCVYTLFLNHSVANITPITYLRFLSH